MSQPFCTACAAQVVHGDLDFTPRWNFNKGLQQQLGGKRGPESGGDLQVEDLAAALAVAAAILDTTRSRSLSLGAVAQGTGDQRALYAALADALLTPAGPPE